MNYSKVLLFVFSLSFLALSNTSYAQMAKNKKLIVNNWTFDTEAFIDIIKEAVLEEEPDADFSGLEESLAPLVKEIEGMGMEFRADGRAFLLIGGERTPAKWKLEDNGETLVIMEEGLEPDRIVIMGLTENRLMLINDDIEVPLVFKPIKSGDDEGEVGGGGGGASKGGRKY